MSKTIWISRDDKHSRGDIWSAKPLKLKAAFVSNSETGESDQVAYGADNDFFGVQPGECRRFLVIPDDDWIPVSSGRVPKLGQTIWVTAVGNKRHVYRTVYDGEFGKVTVAWKPRVELEPEPYKPEADK